MSKSKIRRRKTRSYRGRRPVVFKTPLFIAIGVVFLALLLFKLYQINNGNTLSVSSTKPNIVVFMADDLDKALFDRMYAEGFLDNIKNYLGTQGTTFNNAFHSTSLCCPGRATFFSGQYSHNHRVFDNINTPEAPGSVTAFNDDSTLVTWLNDAGYLTVNIGKYLNNYGTDSSKPVTDPRNPAYKPPGWDYWHSLITYNMYNYKMSVNGVVKTYGSTEADYQTDRIKTLAKNYINGFEAADTTPFYMMVTPFAPHQEIGTGALTTGCSAFAWKYAARPANRHANSLSSWTLPFSESFNEVDLSDKPPIIQAQPQLTSQEQDCANFQYRKRAESMRAFDDLVGEVVNTLTTNGEIENTVLVFTSDNGYFLGEHRLWGKIIGYEESLRNVLIIRAPGIPAGQTVDQFVLSNDMAPTLTELTGTIIPVSAPAVDGRSLVPLLQNPNLSDWRKRFLFEYQGAAAHNGVVIPKFFGVRTSPNDTGVAQQVYTKWNDNGTEYTEYYDLMIDPFQLDSKHNDASRSAQMQTLLGHVNNLQACTGSSCVSFEN